VRERRVARGEQRILARGPARLPGPPTPRVAIARPAERAETASMDANNLPVPRSHLM
jgi:hypothetical protein